MHDQVTPRQIRAARAFLDLSQDELADKAIVSRSSVRRLERGESTTTDVYFRVVQTLQTAGIEFEAATETRGEGVRLRKPAR